MKRTFLSHLRWHVPAGILANLLTGAVLLVSASVDPKRDTPPVLADYVLAVRGAASPLDLS